MMINAIIRPLMNFKQMSGIEKTYFYTTFDSDGLSTDYPIWFYIIKNLILLKM